MKVSVTIIKHYYIKGCQWITITKDGLNVAFYGILSSGTTCHLGPQDVVGGMRKGGAEGVQPLDGRLLGDVGGSRWSVGRWWAI